MISALQKVPRAHKLCGKVYCILYDKKNNFKTIYSKKLWRLMIREYLFF